MINKWRFGSTDAISALTCGARMSVVAVALLVAVGCSGDLANTPTSPAIEEIRNPQPAAFSMSGRAFDADTGDAIEGALVRVEGDGGSDQALTGANGEYRFEGLGGDVVVSASARGYVQTEGVRVRMDGDVRLDIDLGAQTDESNNRIPLQQQ